MNKKFRLTALGFMSSMVLVACGGGGSDTATAPAPTPSPTPSPAPTPIPSTGPAAAAQTAQGNPACTAIVPFYWEIGDVTSTASNPKASGSIPDSAGNTITQTDPIPIASASKWLYSSYFVQKNTLTSTDIPYLNFTSGYDTFNPTACSASDTVQTCMAAGIGNAPNGGLTTADVGSFHYSGGHMQELAVLTGLSDFNSSALATEVLSEINTTSDLVLSYTDPQLAGGAKISPAAYAAFLRELLLQPDGTGTPQLKMGTMLSSNPVLTTGGSSSSPIPKSWSYGLGHWIETDSDITAYPSVPPSDGAFSSGGALGFYPWVSANQTLYGLIARVAPPSAQVQEGYASMLCGKMIRLAYTSGTAQLQQPQ